MKKFAGIFAFVSVVFLAACGDDGSSGKPASEKDGTASVPTYDDLAHCTKSHYGEIVFVEDESAYFECTSEDWAEVDESKLDSLLAAASSSSEADEDKPKSSSSLKADSTETADVEKVEVDSITVKGFAQKGPFASGTAVTVYGLDSLLEKTKTKFTGKVSGDSGAFKVEKIVLPSQYALVEVSGYYQNEVTGKKTSGSKTTLSALVDLSEGKTVKANVNLFTDLEYARAKHLVLKEKFNVPAAKKRATKELLAIFGGKGDDDLTATALSLSDTTSAGKALLFASILLQGDLSASKFGILLGGIEEIFGSTGGLDSAEATAAFADWASKVDSTDNFAAIRENVKAMKLVAAVPDFESALYAFWTNEYGLGACTDSLESTIEKNSNKKSENYGAGYACTAKRWHKATALDTELGLCTGKMEGQFKEYKGGKTAEYYVCKAGSWNKITETQFELKECTEDRDNEYVATKSKEYFVCTGKQWIEIDALTYELKLCTEDRNLELVKIDKSGSYVCEWSDGEGVWRKATDVEAELGVCGGKDIKADGVYKTEAGDYYQCSAGKWEKSTQLSYELQSVGTCTEDKNLTSFETATLGLYVCDAKEWRKASDLEVEIGVCGSESKKDSSLVQTKTGAYYACLAQKWTTSDAVTYKLGFCKATMQDVVGWTGEFLDVGLGNIPDSKSEGNYYHCDNLHWVETDKLNYLYGATCKNASSYVNYGWNNETYVMDVLKKDSYKYARFFGESNTTNLSASQLSAYETMAAVGEKTADYVYCDNDEWSIITRADFEMRSFCNADNVNHHGQGLTLTSNTKSSIYWWCESSGTSPNVSYSWREMNEGEIANDQLCTSALNDYKVHNGYICLSNGWRKASTAEIATGSLCYSSVEYTVKNGYVCEYNSGYKWREATAIENEVGKVCKSMNGCYYLKSACDIERGYVCILGEGWRTLTVAEAATNKICTFQNAATYNGNANAYNAAPGTTISGYTCTATTTGNTTTYAWKK